jgi:hypothetical protein
MFSEKTNGYFNKKSDEHRNLGLHRGNMSDLY